MYDTVNKLLEIVESSMDKDARTRLARISDQFLEVFEAVPELTEVRKGVFMTGPVEWRLSPFYDHLEFRSPDWNTWLRVRDNKNNLRELLRDVVDAR